MIVSKTYLGGMPFWFKVPPADARLQSLALRTMDFRQIRALHWAPAHARGPEANRKIGVVLMHPRVDFTHHYAIPRLVASGFSVLAANTRFFGNETAANHEEMLFDVGACVRWLREKGGAEKVVLLGNCGGASLMAYYQAEVLAGNLALVPGDLMIYVAAHRGQGHVVMNAIDAAVVDEARPLESDPSLDMYDARNGFRPPPEWSRYDEGFLARYRAAQVERVKRLDAVARAHVEDHRAAEKSGDARAATFEPIMTVYRTSANPAFVDNQVDASPRDYGSLLSEQPNLMNYASLGIARTCTPRAWLSTWSGISSKADLPVNAARFTTPTLVVAAARDREVFPRGDTRAIFDAVGAKPEDKKLVTIEGARHYFEPEPEDFAKKETPHVDALMDVVIPFVEERLA